VRPAWLEVEINMTKRRLEIFIAIIIASFCCALISFRVGAFLHFKLTFLLLIPLCILVIFSITLLVKGKVRLKIFYPSVWMLAFIFVPILYIFNEAINIIDLIDMRKDVAISSWMLVVVSSVILNVLVGFIDHDLNLRRIVVWSTMLIFVLNVSVVLLDIEVGEEFLTVQKISELTFSLFYFPLVSSQNGSNVIFVLAYIFANHVRCTFAIRTTIMIYFLLAFSFGALACLLVFHLAAVIKRINLRNVYFVLILACTAAIPIVISSNIFISNSAFGSSWGALNGREFIWSSMSLDSFFSLRSLFGHGFFGHVNAGIYQEFAVMFSKQLGIQGMHNTPYQIFYDIGFIGLVVYVITLFRVVKFGDGEDMRAILALTPIFTLESLFTPYSPEAYIILNLFVVCALKSSGNNYYVKRLG